MIQTKRRARPQVALAGNPNTGKTTLFNQLTGSDHKVGNYPGVTVDRHIGKLLVPELGLVDLMDVPGTYSLSARSREEQLAIQAVAGLDPCERPDVVLLVVDATQLARNLYLALQVIELGLPVVIALNMTDELEKTGRGVDVAALEEELGVPVAAISALRRRGLAELRDKLGAVLGDTARGTPGARWQPTDEALVADVEAVGSTLPDDWTSRADDRSRALALWALLSLDDADELEGVPEPVRAAVNERRRMAQEAGREIDKAVIAGRYGWIDERIDRFLSEGSTQRASLTERIDAVLLNPAAGFAIFLVLMGIVFQSLFSWADPLIGAVEWAMGWLATGVEAVVPEGLVREFLTEGLIAGVGSVVVFLPQILLLFLFVGLMEGTGYMARVAFLMDRLMKALGLHGRAFVPMLSGFACAIPAVLATRTMERRRDRMLTMMVVPLMTCSARLPVYVLIIGALFPPQKLFGAVPVQGLLMVAMYLFSTLVALGAAAVLGRTLFKGPSVPLILELPPYRLPHWPSVLRMMWQKGSVFLREAGGVILVCTIALWILLQFPKQAPGAEGYAERREAVAAMQVDDSEREELVAAIDAEESGARLRASYGGRLGRAFEPVLEPLGFDWKIGIGLIGAFAAREVFVSTLGVVYGVGAEEDESSTTLRETIRAESRSDGKPVYTPLVGLSLMVFFALACQCMSTLAVVKRETQSWGWTIFLFTYMTVLAWVASFVVYQGGRLLGFG